MDSRYSGMPMFEASTISGVSTFEFFGFDQYGEAINDYKIPHVDSSEWFQKKRVVKTNSMIYQPMDSN